MKHLKHHPINNKSQKISKLKREDHTPKKRGGTSKPTNKKLDGEKFLSEGLENKSKEISKDIIEYLSNNGFKLNRKDKEFIKNKINKLDKIVESKNYPKMEEVEKASAEEIMRWQRFLPSPKNDEEVNIINKIFDKYKKIVKKIEDILSRIGVKDWKIGDDHIGNKNVYLFRHKGFDFEVYSLEDIEVDSVKGEAFHVNYGQKGKWIDNFNTMDIEHSLSEIFEKIDNGIGDKYVG